MFDFGLFDHVGFDQTPEQADTGANLAPALFTNANSFFVPTVTPGAVAITPARYDNLPDTFYDPLVGSGSYTLTPAFFSKRLPIAVVVQI